MCFTRGWLIFNKYRRLEKMSLYPHKYKCSVSDTEEMWHICIPYKWSQYSQMRNAEPTRVNHMFCHAKSYQASLIPRGNCSKKYIDILLDKVRKRCGCKVCWDMVISTGYRGKTHEAFSLTGFKYAVCRSMTQMEWYDTWSCHKCHFSVTVGRSLINKYIFQKGLNAKRWDHLWLIFLNFCSGQSLSVWGMFASQLRFSLLSLLSSLEMFRWWNYTTLETPFR